MCRTTSVHYSPPVGCRINLQELSSGATVVASTLSIRDKTPFKHRTTKGTPKGQEYFYVKIRNGNKWEFIKILNSLLLPRCISEDGRFIFEGELPSGGKLVGGQKKEVVRLGKLDTVKPPEKFIQSFSNDVLLNTLGGAP